jgi:hypothetical protein
MRLDPHIEQARWCRRAAGAERQKTSAGSRKLASSQRFGVADLADHNDVKFLSWHRVL